MPEDPAVIEVGTSDERQRRIEEGTNLIDKPAESSSAVLEQEVLSLEEEGSQRAGWGVKAAVWAAFCFSSVGLTVVLFTALSPQLTEPSVSFLVVGDWGRDGLQNQTFVADAMADEAKKNAPAFIISVGDNLYESGLISADDPQFSTSFTDVYHHKSLQVPWHVILGNHDYGEFWNDTVDLKTCTAASEKDCYFSPLHQLNEKLVERDWRWHCERWFQFKLPKANAELFFIDTNPFIEEYHSQPWAVNRGGILEQSWESQLLELDARLAASDSSWKLVFGHHPVRNNHMPQNTLELVEHLEPVLEKRGVQAYFSGHEHNLQHLHLTNATTHYIVSGGGSKTDYFPETYWDNGGSRYQHQGSGFASCSLSKKKLHCDFIGISQIEPLYAIDLSPVS